MIYSSYLLTGFPSHFIELKGVSMGMIMQNLIQLSNSILIIPFILILFSNILITFKTRFIQIRMLPTMIKLFFTKNAKHDESNPNTLPSRQAVLTLISTSLGIGNLVGPIIAIQLGGPGAFLGFLLAVFFGASTIFSEVMLALIYRKRLPNGAWSGGPMPYLKKAIGGWSAYLYAATGAVLLLSWSATQANIFADICKVYKIEPAITGILIAVLVLIYLLGGIRKIGELSSKIVPLMFALITAISLWIIIANISQIPAVFFLSFKQLFTPKAFGGAGIGLMLRWAISKGTMASEAAVGTSTIPNSQAETNNPFNQAIMAMLSAYAVLFISTMVGLVVLVTGSWTAPEAGLGIHVLLHAFTQYLPAQASSLILLIAIFLFAFGTIIGNAFNGGQCFSYLTNNRWLKGYYLAIAAILIFGAIFPVEFIWSTLDIFIIPVALINLCGIFKLLLKHKRVYSISTQNKY